ncbi:MAG: O-antigen ligase family protein [Alphaproteobacteria bacterium]|nr:O-antigen ligase family protein [Alphaproteobacteria bacterium]
MLLALSGLAILTWFAVVYWMIRPVRVVPVAQAEFWVPALLLATFFHLPSAFAVIRKSGTALIEQGLSSSNILTIAVVAVSAVFLLWTLIRYDRLLELLGDRILFPFLLTIAIAICSTLWAIFPLYTFYRAVELGVMFILVVLALDRRDFAKAFINLHVLLLGVWLVISAPEIASSLSNGVVFSSAKQNLIPLMSLSLLWFVMVFPRASRYRLAVGLLAVTAFIAAGSAATVATIPLFALGFMIAANSIWVRGAGVLLTLGYFAVFIFLLVGLSQFPDLVDIIASALQKPPAELLNATGRNELWPLFIEASHNRSFGAGFASERFLQLLVDFTAVQERLGQKEIFFNSAHNMLIGSWLATGWLGLATIAICLASAFREALRLDIPGRQFIIPLLLALIANGMTVQGIFGEFNLHTVTWAALLVMIRVELRARSVMQSAPASPGLSAPTGGLRRGQYS